jgi:hypothetical protein
MLERPPASIRRAAVLRIGAEYAGFEKELQLEGRIFSACA